MIRVNNGLIRKRELTAIVIFLYVIQLMNTTPDTLIKFGKNAAWVLPIISFAVMLIPFLVLLYIVKKHDAGLVELVFSLLGKRIGSFVMFLFFLIIFSALMINSRNYTDVYNTMFYPKTPVPYLYVMLIGASFYIANRGLENIGRTAWILCPLYLFVTYILIFFILEDFSLERIYPIAGPGFGVLLTKGAAYSSIYGESILLLALYPFVRKFKDFRIGVLYGWMVGVVSLAFFMVIYVSIFDFPAVQDIAYPFQQLTRMATLGTIGHLESIYLATWTVASAIHFSIYLYLAAFFLSKMLRLKEFEPLLLPIAGLCVLAGLISPNIFVGNALRETLIQTSTVILVLFPFILWGIDRFKGGKKANAG